MGGVVVNKEADTLDEIVSQIKEDLERIVDNDMDLRHCAIQWDTEAQKWRASMWAHT